MMYSIRAMSSVTDAANLARIGNIRQEETRRALMPHSPPHDVYAKRVAVVVGGYRRCRLKLACCAIRSVLIDELAQTAAGNATMRGHAQASSRPGSSSSLTGTGSD